MNRWSWWWHALAFWQRGNAFSIAALCGIYFSRIFPTAPQFKIRCQLAKLPDYFHLHHERAAASSQLNSLVSRRCVAVERLHDALSELRRSA